jgi:hypothetical protein
MDANRLAALAGLSHEELVARLVKAETGRTTSGGLKVSTKGAVSLYGVGRFPVTLYKSQWDKVIELVQAGTIQQFMVDNAGSLAVKADKDATA